MSYTALAVLGVLGAAALDLAVLRTRLLRRGAFWVAYAIILFFQVTTNGWLTCRAIVTYDRGAILGPRVFCAPVEDLAFGFSLILQTLAWWVWWGRRLSGAGGTRRSRPRRNPAATARSARERPG